MKLEKFLTGATIGRRPLRFSGRLRTRTKTEVAAGATTGAVTGGSGWAVRSEPAVGRAGVCASPPAALPTDSPAPRFPQLRYRSVMFPSVSLTSIEVRVGEESAVERRLPIMKWPHEYWRD